MGDIALADRVCQCIAVYIHGAVIFQPESDICKIGGVFFCDIADITQQQTAGFLLILIAVCRVDDAIVGSGEPLNVVGDCVCARFEADGRRLTRCADTV